MLKRFLWVLVAAIALLICIQCSSTKNLPIGYEGKISGGDRPGWVNAPAAKDTKDAKAFVGVSLNEKMEAQARAGALEDARKQIIDAMGVYGKRKIEEVISTVGNVSDIINPGVVRDEATKLISESIVESRANQFHIERWQKVTETGVEYYYKASVLVLFPNEQAKKYLKDALAAASKQIKNEKDKRNVDRALGEMKDLKSNEW